MRLPRGRSRPRIRLPALAAGALVACAHLAAPSPTVPAEADAEAGRLSRIQGTARTGRRQWVTGATVVVRPESGGSDLRVTTTDEKGSFRITDVPDGTYRIDFLRYDLEPLRKESVPLRFPFRAVVEVVMEPSRGPAVLAPDAPPEPAGETGSLGGKVVDREGAPVPEVRILVARSDGSADPRSALTDADGKFAMDDLPAGVWKVEILGAGYLPMRATATVRGEVILTGVVVPQPADYEPQPLDLMPPEEPIPPPEPPDEDPGVEAAEESDSPPSS